MILMASHVTGIFETAESEAVGNRPGHATSLAYHTGKMLMLGCIQQRTAEAAFEGAGATATLIKRRRRARRRSRPGNAYPVEISAPGRRRKGGEEFLQERTFQRHGADDGGRRGRPAAAVPGLLHAQEGAPGFRFLHRSRCRFQVWPCGACGSAARRCFGQHNDEVLQELGLQYSRNRGLPVGESGSELEVGRSRVWESSDSTPAWLPRARS